MSLIARTSACRSATLRRRTSASFRRWRAIRAWRSCRCGLASRVPGVRALRIPVLLLLSALLPGCGGVSFACVGAGAGDGDAFSDTTFTADRDAEAVARVRVECDACAWDTTGSEAVVLAITLDDRP